MRAIRTPPTVETTTKSPLFDGVCRTVNARKGNKECEFEGQRNSKASQNSVENDDVAASLRRLSHCECKEQNNEMNVLI
jgi:hypothetical protein